MKRVPESADHFIPCQRDKFDIPRDVAFLNCAYISPALNAAREALCNANEMESQPWRITTDDFFNAPEKARAAFATLINATAKDIAIIPATSYGIATAALNLSLQAGQNIVRLENQYPSNMYSWQELAQQQGGEVRVVQQPDYNAGWTQAVLDEINENTAIVALPNCHWMDGGYVDLEQVSKKTREVDAALVLDITQSIGVLSADVEKLQPDFLICSGYKWMMGPYGISFMYVAPKYHDGKALEQSPFNRSNGNDFVNSYKFDPNFVAGARRFDMGQRAQFTLLPGAIAAMQQLAAWGQESTLATLTACNKTLAGRLEGLGLRCLPKSYRAPHFLTAKLPPKMRDGLTSRLADENVFVSQRGQNLRITPHVYNDQQDIDRLVEALSNQT